MTKITLSHPKYPHVLLFTWNGYTVAKAFDNRAEMESYGEHIRRVWNARTSYR